MGEILHIGGSSYLDYIIHRMRTCIQDFLFLSDTGPIIVLRSSCIASDLKIEVTLVVENNNFGHQ